MNPPPLGELARLWFRLGFISFGGPAGQIAIMHHELVERRRWISEGHFLHALNYCMLLPGPEATQLAIYTGWLTHRVRGGILAGTLFILPGLGMLWALGWLYMAYGTLPWVAALFYGLKPAVVAIIIAALVRIGSRVLTTPVLWGVAGAAWVMLGFLDVPFPAVILGAGALGMVGYRWRPALFSGGAMVPGLPAEPASGGASRGAGWRGAVRVACWGMIAWWAPVVAALAWQGPEGIFFTMGWFFSKAAVVTFGGAYAVLPYVSRQAVERFGWIAPGQMLDGLGLAETTPGPLIMVLEFVGFVGGWQNPGTLAPLAAATLGAAITVWVTFVPSFLWVLLGAPWVERMRGHAMLSAGLSAVTAAVVGVIFNLALWFGHQVIFPGPGMDFAALLLSLVVLAGLLRWKWNLVAVVLGSALAGLALA